MPSDINGLTVVEAKVMEYQVALFKCLDGSNQNMLEMFKIRINPLFYRCNIKIMNHLLGDYKFINFIFLETEFIDGGLNTIFSHTGYHSSQKSYVFNGRRFLCSTDSWLS